MADVERRLAAVLSADAVGYSRLMAEDDVGTVQRITEYRELIGVRVREQRGRVVDSPGDNLLAEFPSALDATRCAIEIQRVLKTRNADLPAERRMEFRIGVHLGDVLIEDERIYGDGVNIAARLEGLSEPGGICVSGTVHEQVRHRLELGYEYLGDQEVKSIPDPVRVFRVREAPSLKAEPSARKGAARWLAAAGGVVVVITAGICLWMQLPISTGPPLTSIAVLPFDDMSPSGDQEWLANGMAEELIESLSRIEELQVIARTSAFALRGRNIRTVAAELKVGSVVEGSVRRSGDDLRITAQLIRTSNGTHLWSARYDRELDDVFAMQTEIAQEIAEAIRSELGIEDAPLFGFLSPQRYVPRDVRAYELMRKGIEIARSTFTEAALREEREYLLQALQVDPDYSQAHACVGWNHLSLWSFGYDRRAEQISAARAAANRALELDSTNGLAHQTLSLLSIFKGEFEAAERRLEHALKENPQHGGLRMRYADVLAETGRIEAALSEARRSVQLDPLAPGRRFGLGNMYVLAGHYDAAIESFEYGLKLNPQQPFAGQFLANAYHLNGTDREALEAVIRYLPEDLEALEAPMRRGFEENGYQGMVRILNEQLVTRTGRPCAPEPGLSSHYYAITGDADQMYQCLDEALTQWRTMSLFLKVHPNWDPYRSDPRFQALLRRRGLAE